MQWTASPCRLTSNLRLWTGHTARRSRTEAPKTCRVSHLSYLHVFIIGSLRLTKVKLDYDDHPPFPGCLPLFRGLRHLVLSPRSLRISRSRHNGVHCEIEVEGFLDAASLCFVQLFLGSDGNRECFNFLRARQLSKVSRFWQKRWNILYEGHPQQSVRRQQSKPNRAKRRVR